MLIVDDESDFLRLARVNLTLDGFEVYEAADGEEGVLLALTLQPDCILLDWMMPGMDGLQVCRALRHHPRTQSAAIVVVTAKARPEDRDEAMAAGADDYVVKPVAPEELTARVNQAVRRRAVSTVG